MGFLVNNENQFIENKCKHGLYVHKIIMNFTCIKDF